MIYHAHLQAFMALFPMLKVFKGLILSSEFVGGKSNEQQLALPKIVRVYGPTM